jgi:predicted transcriptional regulator
MSKLISVRLPDTIADDLTQYCNTMDQQKSTVVIRSIRYYLKHINKQIQESKGKA